MKNHKSLFLVILLTFLFAANAIGQVSAGFTSSGLAGATLNNPTSLQFGPDNRLYVSQQFGTIAAYTISRNGPNDYAVTATETIQLINTIPNHNDNGVINTTVNSRQITGILVKGTAANPVIYVSSSDSRIGGGGTGGDQNLDTNSGVVSKLSWNGTSWNKVDMVIGLPRSEENHAVNGMQLVNNTLYLAVGGSTNGGAPSNNFAFLTEYALSAAILKIDLTAIQNNFGGSYVLPTLDDPTRANTGPGGSDLNDPFGGNDGLNQAKLVIGGPVQIHSPGYRNAYDLVITKSPGKEGRMYTIDNGPNGGWGGHPDQEGASGNPLTTLATNNYVIGEPGSTGPGLNDAKVNNKDNLHLVSKPGMSPIYGGHPVPIRANPGAAGLYWYDNNTSIAHFELTPTVDWPPVPLTLANPVEGDFRNPGVNDGALYTWTSSTNGIAEYTSDKFFNGAMVGDLLAASFNGSIYRIKLNDDGTAVQTVEALASGFGSIPLDVVAQGVDEVFEGTIWAATYGSDAITIFEPEGAWEAVNSADLSAPVARHEDAFVETGGKFYLIGGRETTAVNIFNPVTKTWTTGANLPFIMHHFQAVTWQNKIYVMGAYKGFFSTGNAGNSESPVTDIYIYDPATNAWTQGPVIPRPRGSAGVVVYNNEFYLIAGIVNGHANGWVDWVDKYDPGSNTWTELTGVPRFRDHYQASLIGSKIYLTGGRQTNKSGDVFGVTVPEVDVYDIATDTWSTLPSTANVITQRAGTSSVVLGDEIYLIGGESLSQSISHKQNEIFDPVTETWRSSASLLTGRHGTGAIVYNNAIYTAAGSANRGGGPVLATMETFAKTSNCSGDVNNFSLDDDGDGYSNGDETLSGTNPCSASSVPNDFDGDLLSDVSDDDDDNDGVPDTEDLFALDATNGLTITLPVNYPFLNGDPGVGLFGLGFTGLMTNKTDDYLDLFDSEDPDLIMGGAVGIASVPANAGDAITDNQEYAFHFGFKVNPADGNLIITSKLQGTPFFDGIAVNLLENQTQGIYVGTGDQDNYLKFVLSANNGNPGLSIYGESSGTGFINQTFPIAGILTTGILYLYIELDPAASEAKFYYQTGTDASKIQVGTTITLPGFFTELLNGNAAMAAGIIASSGSGPVFSASWDFMTVLASDKPFVIEDAPLYYNRVVGNPTQSFVLDLTKVFNDDGGAANLTYQVVSVEDNTFINNYSISNDVLTINFINNEIGTSEIIIKGSDNDNNFADYQFTMQVIPEPSPFLRINTGGSAYYSWSQDAYFNLGKIFKAIVPISNTTDDILYHSERFGNFTYQIPVPQPGYYRVNLHFAEIFHGIRNQNGVGARVFNVEVEDKIILSNYDIFLAAGGSAKAVVEKLDSVLVVDGFLDMKFTTIVDNAKISAIELSIYTLDKVINALPVVLNPGDRFIIEGRYYSLQIDASDLNFGDILQYEAIGLPASLVIDKNTGLISGTIEASAGNFPVDVNVSDGQGGISQVSFILKIVEPLDYKLRINAGGSPVTYGSEEWIADQYLEPGSSTFSTISDITNTVKDEVYQTERNGNILNYEIPMPGLGRYNLTLHFAEIFHTEPGKRIFDVDIETEKSSLENYDIFQKAGGINIATTESFDVDVTDGSLSISFTAIKNLAKISGIEVTACSSPVVTSFTASANQLCAGENATLTVNGNLGNASAWHLYSTSCAGTLIASNATGIFEVSPTVSTSYYVRGEGGCVLLESCSTLSITVDPAPAVTISVAGPFCTADPSVNLTASVPSGLWSGTGITNAALGTFDPATAGVGSHVITYTVTAGTCISVDTETIQVNLGPDATITSPGLFCLSDAPLNLTAAVPGGTWSGTGITNASLGTFSPSIAGVGSHLITYTLTVGPCTSVKTKTIQVLSTSPNATITAAGPFCESGDPVNLTAATAGGTWSGTGITSSSTGTFDPSAAGPGSFVITYTLSAGSCSSSDTQTIQVDPFSDATITPAGPFCTGNVPVTLTAATAGGTWSGSGITSASLGIFSPSIAGPGSHVITYTITTGACTSVDTETILVPDAKITSAGPLCVTGLPVNLTAFTPGGTWSGVGITNASLGTFNPSVAGAGSHVITYTISGTCTTIDTETIIVDGTPNATITAAGPFCGGNSSVTLASATPGGTWSGTGITSASSGTFSPSLAGPGSHVITYTITQGACTSVDTETILVNPQPNATIAGTTPFCASDLPFQLTAASFGGTWSGNGVTNTLLGRFDPSVAGPGSHVITYTNTFGTCTSTDTETVKVDAIPNVTITAAGPFCVGGAPVNLTAATVGGTWSGNGFTSASLGTFNPSVAGVGSHLIGYTITTGACTVLDTETILVDEITANTAVTLSGTTLTASATGAIYQWINCAGNTNISGATSKTFTPQQSGSYAVRITENGCTSVSACTDVVVVGIEDNYGNSISVYPNPASSVISVNLPVLSKDVVINITDILGKSAIRNSYDYAQSIEMDTRSLNPGIYFINIKTSEIKTTVKLMIR